MIRIITIISRYILAVLFALYTFNGFAALKGNVSKAREKGLYYLQNIWILLFITICNLIIYLNRENVIYVIFLVSEIILIIAIQVIYKVLYDKYNRALLNHLCMLLSLGMVILSRLNPDKALKQLMIAIFATFITSLIPVFITRFDFWDRLTIPYAVIGLLSLGLVLVGGSTEYGAKISLSIAGFSIQPNEFVKILFVLGLSSALYKAKSQKDYLILSIVAMAHVGILVLSKDLGGAAILFVIYLLLFYLSTANLAFLVLGSIFITVGLFFAGYMMPHVHNRIVAWMDPISVIDREGYQVSQSLFAIGTGGWAGSGLTLGMPDKIPVVSKDFIFAAISEEFGAVFAICLIFTYVSCFILIMNLAMKKSNRFESLVAAGFGIAFGFQVFLSIGGVIKFIPSTGVTLPFVSSGGSSLIAQFLMFACIQGMGMPSRKKTKDERYKKKNK